ncbi:DUF234 domain-containing protein [Aliarcobacter vitoriensis]|uniref:DUF234 domain-containing protein n=1 Tax=Aliarcobacter vitoriensis TaxID=2011099 RepID=A0A366MX78_9BACT|nr:DUF234 domain-containing protein [Aliarcobacter vitoriensis]RBQ30022.1 hypothetical protein CRU91_01725 [Aliarcobacter vitoriensis]
MIILDKSIKEQFKIFCKANNIENMQIAIKYFTVFGGLDIKIDTTKPIIELIEKNILNNYNYYKSEINYLTGGYHVDSAILSGIALGDRKTTNAFKRAYVSFEEGMKCVDSLCEKDIIEIDSSQNFLLGKRSDSKVAKKLIFTNPFIRFWFAFISPIYKGIKDGNYEEFKKKFESRESDFNDFIFEELSLASLKDSFIEDSIKQYGQYWDEKIQIPIVAKTVSGKIIVGTCKYTEAKIKKSELNKLLDDCKNTNIDFDIVVLFAKNGFTNELKTLKNDNLRLFSVKSLKILLD